MRKHDAARLVPHSATREHNAATHAWSLILYLLVHHSIFNLQPHLHYLPPIVNLQVLATVGNTAAFRSSPFSKNKARNHSQLGELLLMLVKEGITQTLVRIAHDYSSLGLLNLGEAHLWVVGHIYVGVDAVGEGCSHH